MPNDLLLSNFSPVQGSGCALVFQGFFCRNVFLNATKGSGGTKSFLRENRLTGPADDGKCPNCKGLQRHRTCAEVCPVSQGGRRTVEVVAQAGFSILGRNSCGVWPSPGSLLLFEDKSKKGGEFGEEAAPGGT